jgi:3D (Asp-Asp-Asp) domain-containing protein
VLGALAATAVVTVAAPAAGGGPSELRAAVHVGSEPVGDAAAADTTAGRRLRAPSKAPHRRRRTLVHTGPRPKRAKVGERVPVEITYYCLQGTTRTDRPTRDGIVAADPRVFPLRRHVELFVRGRSIGNFRVDDTGALVRGHVIDVWVPSCADARRRGRRHGYAVLLKKGTVVTEGLAAK